MALSWPWKRLTAAAAPPSVQPVAPESSIVVADKTPPPAAGELGPSGTANFAGYLRVEENTKLEHNLAFGTAGSVQWGEWERLGKTDPHIAMALDFVTAPIRDASWAFEPDENVPGSDKHAEFLEWSFKRIEPGFDELKAAAAVGMLTYGFSLFERVFEVGECELLPGGRGHLLRKLGDRLPSSIHANGWLEGPSLDLEQVHQLGPRNDGTSKFVDVKIPASKVLLFTWKRTGNNYQGVSAFRPVWYLAKIREMLSKMIGITLMREGAGIPIASAVDRNTPLSPDQREDLIELLANMVMHENASVVMPAGWSLEWLYSPGANKGHIVDTWNALGLIILEMLQAQQMVLGTGNTGSRSVGEVHAAANIVYVQGVVSNLEGTFNGVGSRPYTGIIKQLIDVNFGPQKGYPKLNITLKKPQMDPLARTNAAVSAIGAGLLTVTADLENVVREELGFAPIDEAERDAIHAEKSAMAAAISGVKKTDEEADEDEDEKPPAKLAASARRLKDTAFVPSRPLRESEKYLAVQEISDYLDTAREAFEREAKPAIIEMLVRAQSSITAAMADGDPSEVATLPLDTKRLRKVIGTFLSRSRAEGARQVRKELAKGKVAGRLTAAAEEEDDKEAITDTDELIESQEKALTRRMEARLRSELETEAIDAIRTGDDASAVVMRTVTRQLDSSAFRSDAGTIVTKAWNLGRDEAARLLNAGSVEYSAILDSATCEACQEMDGEQADIGSDEHDAMLPPNRDCDGGGNCRCLLVYVPGTGDDEETDDTEGDE